MNYNKDYWDNFYSRYDELPSAPSNFALFVLRFLQERYPPPKKNYKNILDIGCGNGRDSYFFLSQGFNVTGIDSSSNIKNDKFQFLQKSVFDFDIDKLNEFDVCYLRFVIHTLSEHECDRLLAKLSLMQPKTLIVFETRSTTNITEKEKLETNFSSPIGDKHFRMLYSKKYMDKKISELFIVLESSDGSDVAKFKTENPFCLRYIIQPKQ